MRLVALRLKAQIPCSIKLICRAEVVWHLNSFWIKEWCPHVEKGAGQQDALARLILRAHLSLPRHEGRQELIRVVHPPRTLRSQRKQHSIISIESQVAQRGNGNRVLRQPDVLVGDCRRRCGAGCSQRVVIIAQRVETPSRKQLNVTGKMNPVLHNRRRLMIVLPQRAWTGRLKRVLKRDRKST